MSEIVRFILWLVALILMAPLWLLGFGFSGGLNWFVVLFFFPLVVFPIVMMAFSVRDWRAGKRPVKDA